MLKRVKSRHSVEVFCLIELKNFVGQAFCAKFQKISVSEKNMDRSVGVVSRFSVENFL